MVDNSPTGEGVPRRASERAWSFLRSHWQLLTLGVLIAGQWAVNWAWLSTNTVILGWDRPRHLIESLVYNDILDQVTLRSLFQAWTHSGYYPPLYHLAMVTFYKLFGVSMDVAVSVNMIFVVALLLAAYGIGSRIGGRGVGLLSAFITSTLPMIFGMSRYTYIEFALTSVVAVSMWLLLLSDGFRSKRYSLLFGVCAGIGLLTKWTFVLFVFPGLVVVIWRSGLLSRLGRGLRDLHLDLKWMGISAVVGAVLTAAWYLPNLDLVSDLPLGHLLLPISWFLLAGLIYLLRRPSSPGLNLVASLWLSVTVAGSWYVPRIDFISHTFLIAWGRPERQKWAFEYYLNHLVNEQLSLVHMLLLLLVSLGLLLLAWGKFKKGSVWKQTLNSEFLLLALWSVVPYLVFSFRPSSQHSRFIMPILPALAVLMAYGLLRIRLTKLRLSVVALVLLLGTTQWLALSFDRLGWLRDLAVVGPVNVFAHMFQNQLPNSGDTDRGYWVVPDVLAYVSEEAERRGQPAELGMLVNTRQVHDEHFLYLIYTDFPAVRLRELAQNWTGRPAYPQLFEVDYVAVPSANPDHKLDPESLEVVETILQRTPTLFREAFRVVREYPLPNGNVIYLYEKEYVLPEGYEAEQYETLGSGLETSLGDDGVLVLHPEHQVPLLGRYYEGRPDLVLLPDGTETDPAAATAILEQSLPGHKRIGAVFEAGEGEDVQAAVGEWLTQNLYQAVDTWYGPARLTLYDAGPAGQLAGSLEANFGGEITLVARTAPPESMQAGEILPVTLLWRSNGSITRDYKVFLHLIDREGNLSAQRDSEPVGGWRPTSGWESGEEIEDRHGILTDPDLPAGDYELVLGLYDSDGERLPVLDGAGQIVGDKLSLGAVEIKASCFCAGKETTTEETKYEDPTSSDDLE
jgi:4-amino-4-deoxy-L-arabinose transferase-like glycosyltransferase